MLRLSALFHLVEHAEKPTQVIGKEAMVRALALAPYMLAHARIALDAVGFRPEYITAGRVLKWIERRKVAEVPRRDLCDDLGLKVEQLSPALDLLEDHGYVRRITTKPGSKGGRPALSVAVHPGPDPMRRPWRCVVCGAPLSSFVTGRPRLTCSPKCRSKRYRVTKRSKKVDADSRRPGKT